MYPDICAYVGLEGERERERANEKEEDGQKESDEIEMMDCGKDNESNN